MGTLTKENPSGKFIGEFKSSLDGYKFEAVDIAGGLALILAGKDDDEMVLFKMNLGLEND